MDSTVLNLLLFAKHSLPDRSRSSQEATEHENVVVKKINVRLKTFNFSIYVPIWQKISGLFRFIRSASVKIWI